MLCPFPIVVILIFSSISETNAQMLQCTSVNGGCDGGVSHEAALQNAIGNFNVNSLYGGGGEPVVFSSSLSGGSLAQVSYSCTDGSIPPNLNGSSIRTYLESILACPNQCGSVAVAGSDICGLGVLIADGASDNNCFNKAINVIPQGRPIPDIAQLVTSVGSFANVGCFSDSASQHVLVADSSVDQTETGMTVEKCIAFAQLGVWRYAGLEAGGECFVGNTLHNATVTGQGECSMTCAGDNTELCGASDRILVYADSSWIDPTAADLISTLRLYNESLAQVVDAVSKYNRDIVALQVLEASQPSKFRKRTLTQTIEAQQQAVSNDYIELESVSRILDQAAAQGNRLFFIAGQRDIVRPAASLVGSNAVEQLRGATITGSEAVSDVLSAAAEDSRSIAASAANSETALLNFQRDLAVSNAAANAIGIPEFVGPAGIAATGIFLVIAALVSIFDHGGQTSPASTIISSATSIISATATTTTSSSTTCTFTEGPTPIIIVTNTGTTQADYDALVKNLPSDSSSVKITDPAIDNWAYITTMDRCTAEALWDNPIVAAMAINSAIVSFDADNVDPNTINPTSSATITKYKRDKLVRRNETISERTLTGTTQFVLQNNSPTHLKWISAQSRQTTNRGAFYDFEDYMYDDRLSSGKVYPNPVIYVIDSSFQVAHNDFEDRIIQQIHVNGNTVRADGNHGTCMASLAGGAYSGVYKDAKLVLVSVTLNNNRLFPLDSAIYAFTQIIKDVRNGGYEGKAVLSMSFAAPTQYLWYGNNANLPTTRKTDVIGIYLEQLYRLGVAAVTSAGNFALNGGATVPRLDYHTPRRNGGANTPLIVVGNADSNGIRVSTSQYLDPDGRGILTMYANGDQVECALASGVNNWGIEPSGTSQATAQVAGMLAYFLSDPALQESWVSGGVGNMPMNAKNYLINLSTQQKGTVIGDGLPRLANGVNIGCTTNVINGAPRIPVFVPPPSATSGRTLDTSTLSNGASIVYSNPLPQCYNRA